jgi:hypothetical protein
VISEPEDQVTGAWASLGRLRASHADRENLVGVLKAAFVQGRLTKDEFDTRVSQAFGARTYADLAAITADIPAGSIAAGLRRPPAPAQTAASEAAVWSTAATFLAVTLVACMFLDTQYLGLVAGTITGIVFATVAQMLYARHERRSRGHLPPRSAQPGPFGQMS